MLFAPDCHWLVPAGLWSGLVLVILVLLAFCWWLKRRSQRSGKCVCVCVCGVPSPVTHARQSSSFCQSSAEEAPIEGRETGLRTESLRSAAAKSGSRSLLWRRSGEGPCSRSHSPTVSFYWKGIEKKKNTPALTEWLNQLRRVKELADWWSLIICWTGTGVWRQAARQCGEATSGANWHWQPSYHTLMYTSHTARSYSEKQHLRWCVLWLFFFYMLHFQQSIMPLLEFTDVEKRDKNQPFKWLKQVFKKSSGMYSRFVASFCFYFVLLKYTARGHDVMSSLLLSLCHECLQMSLCYWQTVCLKSLQG